MQTEVAQWRSRSGKDVVTMYRDESGFSYIGTGCGGYFGNVDEATAFQKMERLLPSMQPDANKTPMRRVS